MEVMKDLFLDAPCIPENAFKLHRKAAQRSREVSSLGAKVSPGPSNLFVGMMSKELFVCHL